MSVSHSGDVEDSSVVLSDVAVLLDEWFLTF
jgi:hypothetical protein